MDMLCSGDVNIGDLSRGHLGGLSVEIASVSGEVWDPSVRPSSMRNNFSSQNWKMKANFKDAEIAVSRGNTLSKLHNEQIKSEAVSALSIQKKCKCEGPDSMMRLDCDGEAIFT